MISLLVPSQLMASGGSAGSASNSTLDGGSPTAAEPSRLGGVVRRSSLWEQTRCQTRREQYTQQTKDGGGGVKIRCIGGVFQTRQRRASEAASVGGESCAAGEELSEELSRSESTASSRHGSVPSILGLGPVSAPEGAKPRRERRKSI